MDMRFIKVTGLRVSETTRVPIVRFNGDWLARAGFEKGPLVLAEFTSGEAVFRLCKPDTGDVKGLICRAKKEKGLKLTLVRSSLSRGKGRPLILLRGLWLDSFGFHAGALLAVKPGYGLIRAKVIDTNIFEP